MLDRKFGVLILAEGYIARLINPELTSYNEMREYNKKKNILDIEGINASAVLGFNPVKTGQYTYEVPDNVVDTITEKCDVVFLAGFNRILRGNIITKPRFGTLSFHPSDIRKYRGRPSCFFEWINGEDEIGITLQQLTEELDGGNIVYQEFVNIDDANSLLDVKSRVKNRYGDIAAQGLNQFEDPEFEPESIMGKGQLSYSYEKDKLNNAIKCVLTNIKMRYFN